MKSRLTLALAGVLLTGAVIAGYQGLKLSMNAPPQTKAEGEPIAEPIPTPTKITEQVAQKIDQEQRSSVVVLAKDLPPNVPITANDVRIEQLLIAPPDSFHDINEVIGLQIWQTLPAGKILNKHSFSVGGPLARMIGPDERALAIAVDDIVAGGGFIRPGDYVDVILYLREDQHNTQQTAQVVVPALRVLSYGEALGLNSIGEPVNYETEDANQHRRRSGNAGNAVLAVPTALLNHLILATEAGKLRLAVRSAEESLLVDYYAQTQTRQEKAKADQLEAKALATVMGNRPQPANPALVALKKPLTVPQLTAQPVTAKQLAAQQVEARKITELQRQLVAFESLALSKNTPRVVSQARPARQSARAVGVTVYRGTHVSKQTP